MFIGLEYVFARFFFCHSRNFNFGAPPPPGAKIRARLRPGARAPVLRRLLPCASRRAPSGARPAAMPAAYTDDLAWRVVMRVHFFRQDVATVCDSRLGWACRGTT